MLRKARRDAGRSQRDVARLTGVPESRISDYEHGRHQPSAAMLQRLLAATGHELIAARRRSPDPERNARVFADVLSIVDAVPFGLMQDERVHRLPEPPTWSEVISRARKGL